MADFQLVNENGSIVAKDPETGETRPIKLGDVNAKSVREEASRAPPTPESSTGLVSRDYQSADGPELINVSNVNHLVDPGTAQYNFTNTSYETVLHEMLYNPFVGRHDSGPVYVAFTGQAHNDTDGETVSIRVSRDPNTAPTKHEIELTNNSGERFMTPFLPIYPHDTGENRPGGNLMWIWAEVRVSGGTGHLHRMSSMQTWGF